MRTESRNNELTMLVGSRVEAIAICYAYIDGKTVVIAKPGTKGRFQGWIEQRNGHNRLLIQWRRNLIVPCDSSKVRFI